MILGNKTTNNNASRFIYDQRFSDSRIKAATPFLEQLQLTGIILR